MDKKGSVFGGALLLTGSCIGVGMLGLPILTGIAGFFPSLGVFLLVWGFVTLTSFFMVEIIGWFKEPVNLISMVSETLGVVGKILCWVLYLFLFYALLVAYIALSGKHTAGFLQEGFAFTLPSWAGSCFFVAAFGALVCLGTGPVDRLNRFLMLGKVLTYLILIVCSVRFVSTKLLSYAQPTYVLTSLPILVTAFGFQNMVPSLMRYMGGDRKRVRQSILIGSTFTLVIYLIWQLIVLGILPINAILESYREGQDATFALGKIVGSVWIGYSSRLLAFFALLTSFLAQSLSLVHFLSDGLRIKHREHESVGMCLLTLAPPLILSILFPDIFFKALDFAGGICAVILLGILPGLMTWIGRYRKGTLLPDRVMGGKGLLVAAFLFSAMIFFYQLTNMLGIPLFPRPGVTG